MLGMRTVVSDLLELIEDPDISQDILLHIVHALATLGDHNSVDKQEIAYKLVELLCSVHIDRYRGQNIIKLLCALGEYMIEPDLLNLLSNSAVDRDIRQCAADALAQFAHDEQTLTSLTKLLHTTDIADDVFRTLWAVSRRVKSQKLM